MTDSATSGAVRYAAFAPLEDGGRVEGVARRLGEAIALGLIADGEQLPSETELAGQLNVATVTLREALSTLRHDGLLETRRGRGGGSFVRAPADPSVQRARQRLHDISVHELREIGDQHAAIGGTAALLAAQRAAAENIAALYELVDQLAEAGSTGERRRADGRFHIELAAAAQSSRLTRQEIDLQAEIGELLWTPSSEAIPHPEVVNQHRRIIEALQDGDGTTARSLVEAHLGQGIERLIEFHLRVATM